MGKRWPALDVSDHENISNIRFESFIRLDVSVSIDVNARCRWLQRIRVRFPPRRDKQVRILDRARSFPALYLNLLARALHVLVLHVEQNLDALLLQNLS